MNRKILVIASGGLDSTVLLYKAKAEVGAENVVILTASYGSKHNSYERRELDWQLEHLGIMNMTAVNLFDIYEDNTDCTLLRGNGDIEHSSYAEQTDGKNPVATYVPFRNGLFLSIAAAKAISWDCTEVWYGAHADDAAGAAYPDCSESFVEAMNHAIELGTANKVTIKAPWLHLNKAGVVAEGIGLGMTNQEFKHTRSCYEDSAEPCRQCATCLDRAKAFELNGLPKDL